MDIRDPLYSVIAFLLILLIIIFSILLFERVREKIREKKLNSLLESFDFLKVEDLKLDNSSLNALFLLAKAYEKEGNFESALKIYLWIHKNRNDLDILRSIAFLYYKAGFLEKAKQIIYQILEVRPRDVKSLKLLILINEKLNNLKEIIDVLEVFEELDVNLEKEKAYALFKIFTQGGCNIEFCKGFDSLEDVFREYPFIKREYLEFLFRIDSKKAYSLIKEDEVNRYLDLFWYRNDIPDEDKFCNVLAAKHLKECNKEDIFEIEVLKYLEKPIADLEFEYICSKCHNIYPFYTTRCPNCNELFEEKLVINLKEAYR